jgi:phage gp45-like
MISGGFALMERVINYKPKNAKRSKKFTIYYDNKDHKLLADRYLRIHFNGNKYHVVTTVGNSHSYRVDRLILGDKIEEGLFVVHKDGNTLNLSRKNLLITTWHGVSMWSKRNKKNKTHGLTHKKNGNYEARLYIDGKSQTIGTFSSYKEAAIAYNSKALEIYGKHAMLNPIKKPT